MPDPSVSLSGGRDLGPLFGDLCDYCDGQGFQLIEAGQWERKCEYCDGSGLVAFEFEEPDEVPNA